MNIVRTPSLHVAEPAVRRFLKHVQARSESRVDEAPSRRSIEPALVADLLLLASLGARAVLDHPGVAANDVASEPVVDLRAPYPSTQPAPAWADVARCL